jgi:hypothetical protein
MIPAASPGNQAAFALLVGMCASAAAGAHFTLHGVVFVIFVEALR